MSTPQHANTNKHRGREEPTHTNTHTHARQTHKHMKDTHSRGMSTYVNARGRRSSGRLLLLERGQLLRVLQDFRLLDAPRAVRRKYVVLKQLAERDVGGCESGGRNGGREERRSITQRQERGEEA